MTVEVSQSDAIDARVKLVDTAIDREAYVREDSSSRIRPLRMWNIAIAVAKYHRDSANTLYNKYDLRHRIRGKIGLCQLYGESQKGDMRANGDAIGEHGLRLKVESDKYSCGYVVMNEDNVLKCIKHLICNIPSSRDFFDRSLIEEEYDAYMKEIGWQRG